MRRRFEIKNETRYRTADIRRILRGAAAEVFDPGDKPIIRCRVVYARRGRVSGCASIGGTMMTLRIGRHVSDVRLVGALVVHEMGHLRGLQHPQMRGAPRWTWRGYPRGMEWAERRERWLKAHEWARGLALHEETPEHRPRLVGAVLIEKRREQTVQSLERWTKKARRAANAMKKLRARLRYYDRRAAALAGESRE